MSAVELDYIQLTNKVSPIDLDSLWTYKVMIPLSYSRSSSPINAFGLRDTSTQPVTTPWTAETVSSSGRSFRSLLTE